VTSRSRQAALVAGEHAPNDWHRTFLRLRMRPAKADQSLRTRLSKWARRTRACPCRAGCNSTSAVAPSLLGKDIRRERQAFGEGRSHEPTISLEMSLGSRPVWRDFRPTAAWTVDAETEEGARSDEAGKQNSLDLLMSLATNEVRSDRAFLGRTRNVLLSGLGEDPDVTDIRWAVYMLATVRHECANTWRPIEEYGKGQGRPYGQPTVVTDQNGTQYTNT
jgi:hypothetical protein